MKTFKLLNNNKGSVIIVSILALAAISITVYMSVGNSVTSSNYIRNTREYKTNQNKSESLLTLAQELHKETWLDSGDTYKLFDLSDTDAKYTFSKDSNFNDEVDDTIAKLESDDELLYLIGDDEDIPLGNYEIARIENSPSSGSLSDDFHKLSHTSHPLPGSGFSPKDFETRRYGIKATGSGDNGNSKVRLEAGMFKYFKK